MTHGLNQYVNFGNRNIIAIDENVARRKNGGNAPDAYETAQTFTNALDPILDIQAKVILYACLSGSTISANDWSNRDVPRRINLLNEEISNGAEGCVARGIKDFLNENGSRREIWAHRTKGHSTGNPVWRVFKGPTVSGPLNDDNPFLNPGFGCSGNARDKLARLVKEQLNLRSIQFNEDEYKTFKNWMAMEIPFVADTIWPLVSEEPTTPCRSANYVFKDGLVDWFVNKWVSQNSNTP